MDFELIDSRLRGWAAYFRSRMVFGRCGSAEGNYRRVHEDFAAEGWSAPPGVRVAVSGFRDGWVRDALEVEDEVRLLPLVQRWALTYAYVHAGMPRQAVLRRMRRMTGRRLGWNAFIEQVDIGRARVWRGLYYSVLYESNRCGVKETSVA